MLNPFTIVKRLRAIGLTGIGQRNAEFVLMYNQRRNYPRVDDKLITKQLARIPIKFNVSITAEFLKLIGSIRGIYDPSYAAERDLRYLIEQERGVPPIDEAKQVKGETSDE